MSDPEETPEPLDPLDMGTPWWSAESVPVGTEANGISDTGDDASADTGAAETARADGETGAPGPERTGTASRTDTGTLVAGPGVPPLDTRGAVPAEPVMPLPGLFFPDSLFPDTDPDGIPVQYAVPAPAGFSEGGGRRPLLVIGGGIVAAALIAALAFAGLRALSGPSGQDAAATRPTAAPPADPRAAGRGKPASVSSIDDERTDPGPLSLREVFPAARIELAGHPYTMDLTSVNRRCELAARGAMATALRRGHCRGVIRATFVDGTKYAVTTGVAIMPTRRAAVAASRAGDPSRYEWFRGMRGTVATKIDQAGGYASSTVRGRYIVYAYAQYSDGTRPRTANLALRDLTRRFIAYAVRPIDRRAR
jgi:hypothetical protein